MDLQDFECLKQPDRDPCNIDLPPMVPMACRPGECVMVVVPAFSPCKKPDNEVVSAIVARLVVARAAAVSDRIHSESYVPDQDEANEYAHTRTLHPDRIASEGVSPAATPIA